MLLSGGLDSTVCMAVARADGHDVVAVCFDYGQRHRIELGCSAAVAAHFHAEHIVVSLNAGDWGGSALTDPTIAIPQTGTVSSAGIPVTYVPARNIIFLSIALGIAEARAADAVYIGVNALDYSGYPDCRPEFIEAFRVVAAVGQRRGVEGNPVQIVTPLLDLTKADIVRTGVTRGAPLQLTWSCYEGGAAPCGACEACVLRARGFAEAGIADPALEAHAHAH